MKKLQAFLESWRMHLGGDVATRAVRVVTLAVVGLGLLLRIRGIVLPAPGNSLWLDESQWVVRILELPLSEHLIRPIAFMAITKGLVSVFGPYGLLFRLMPWLGGLATTLMALPLARRLFRSEAARLLFVSIIVLSPSAIDLSKDFKPYAVSLALHMGMLLLALRYRETGRRRDLLAACGLIAPSVLFAQDAVFAYPSLFLLMGAVAWRSKRTRHLAGIAAATLVTLGLVAGLYFFVWSKLESKSESKYWGEKYDVFYVKKTNPQGKADWFVRHYIELTAFPGERRDIWNDRLPDNAKRNLASVDAAIWLALHVAGLTVLARGQKLTNALLLVGPIALMSAFNLKGIWPFGHFRANLFVIVYLAGIAATAVDRRALKTRLWDLLPSTALVILPLLFLEKTWHAHKEANWVAEPSFLEQSARELLSLQAVGATGRPELVVVDHYAGYPLLYYTEHNPITKQSIGVPFLERFRISKRMHHPKRMFGEIRKALDRGHPRVWMLIGSEALIRELEKTWPRDLERFKEVNVGDGGELIIGVKKAQPPAG